MGVVSVMEEFKKINELKELEEIDDLRRELKNLSIDTQRFFYQNNERARYILNFVLHDYLYFYELGPITREKFFLEFLKHESIVEFRERVNRLSVFDASFELFLNVQNYYQEILDTYHESTQLFSYQEEVLELLKKISAKDIKSNLIVSGIDIARVNVMDENERISYFKAKASVLLSNIIIDSLFEDNYYNVSLNIKELLRFSHNRDMLSKERMDFYQSILNMDDLSNQEKLSLYSRLKEKDMKAFFYDDMRNARNFMLMEIRNSLVDLKEHQQNYCSILSKLYGVPIYDFQKEKYMLLARTLEKPFKEQKFGLRRACYSFISNDRTETFCEDIYYRYGYTNFDIDKVLHVSENDSYSDNNLKETNKTGTNYVNRLITPEELLFRTDGINEIQILNDEATEYDYSLMKPDVILTNHINRKVTKEARRLKIPILIIASHNLLSYEETKEEVYIRDHFHERILEDGRLSNILERKRC